MCMYRCCVYRSSPQQQYYSSERTRSAKYKSHLTDWCTRHWMSRFSYDTSYTYDISQDVYMYIICILVGLWTQHNIGDKSLQWTHNVYHTSTSDSQHDTCNLLYYFYFFVQMYFVYMIYTYSVSYIQYVQGLHEYKNKNTSRNHDTIIVARQQYCCRSDTSTSILAPGTKK